MLPFNCKDWHNSEWWRKVRRYLKIKRGWKCSICGVVSEGVEVDHVIPYDNSLYTDEEKRKLFTNKKNHWVLCPRCHRRKTQIFDIELNKKKNKLGSVPYLKNRIKEELNKSF